MAPSSVLANRDFRLLFTGRCVSLLGDGAFLVAMAWEAYTLSGAPTALSLLGIAMTVPLIALLLFGGVVSDSHGRRKVMLSADLVRAALLALLAALAASGTLRLWQMMIIVAIYGGAQAFFDPASDAILPELVPDAQLGEANALEQVVRPLALRLAGPALGGVLVGVLGLGAAFLADSLTFVVSAATLWSMSTRASAAPAPAPAALARAGGVRETERATAAAREGWAYVRGHVWLWGTFASAGVAYLLFMGPAEVLLPFMVKHVLRGSGVQLGLVLGAGGLGSVAAALVMTRSGLPSRSMTFIYLVWTLGTLAVAGYGLATSMWELMLASVAFNLLETAGTIVWATMKQRHVPGQMLGRVSSLDWLISIGLLPISFALTAPLSAAFGVRATLIGAGVAGAAATLGGLMLPGMRGVDRQMASTPRGGVSPPTSVAQAS
ncbi:MAG TPA: MFS transporter [Solirubrobacteraceae bacterium]|jgi:MFS family permease|nr:MFS transporter [Solirubrobacteraceae bacterium]